jgi:multiple sugar transport system ATP-binding protein
MGGIRLDGVSKVYDNGVRAVDGVSLDVADGEFVVLVGPSGCGKSTLLRMIAGLEAVSDGSIWIGDQDVTTAEPRARDIAMVFQNYALYPQMSVRENLEFGLRMRKVAKAERDRRVREAARVLGLDEMLDRRPAQLSGGQRQRVAMGRAMVRDPAAFLMDEPLSNLDAKLRVSMRAELSRLHERLGVTTIYVTHDQVEAMTLGTRVAILRDGVLQQVDRPQVLFDRPVNLFVAAFIGSPSMNLVSADVRPEGAVELAGTRLPLGDAPAPQPGQVVLGVRPDDLELVGGPGDANGRATLEVTVDVVEELGNESHVVFGLDALPVEADAVIAARDDGDDDARLLMDDRRALWTARVPGRRSVRVGQRATFAIDPRRLYYFDPVTGAALHPAAR